MKLAELIRRPQLTYDMLAPFDKSRPELPRSVRYEAEVSVKYDGYIRRQVADASRMGKLSEKKLPPDLDYSEIEGLRLEARQKLNKAHPLDIGQASRISGVSPADVSVLLVYLKMREK